MSATTWLIIAIVGFSMSGVALAITIFMFIKMNIPAVIGDLTGKTVARQVKAMRDANKSNNDNVNIKLSLEKAENNSTENRITEPLSSDEKTEILYEVHETEVLSDSAGTEVLNEKEEKVYEWLEPVSFTVTKSIIQIHTDEII